MSELLPRVQALAAIARSYHIGFNIDAEEADRLEISLDLLPSLAEDQAPDDWNVFGCVVQVYGKRCMLVIASVLERARSTLRRTRVRPVTGPHRDRPEKRSVGEGRSAGVER